MKRYDHLPEWDKLRKSYALAQLDFDPPKENGIGVHRVLNITEGFGFRGGLHYLSIPKFTKLVQAFRGKWAELNRLKSLGNDVPTDEEFIYGKSNRQRSEGNNRGKRSWAYSTSTKVQKKLDRGKKREVSNKQTDSKIRDDAQRLF